MGGLPGGCGLLVPAGLVVVGGFAEGLSFGPLDDDDGISRRLSIALSPVVDEGSGGGGGGGGGAPRRRRGTWSAAFLAGLLAGFEEKRMGGWCDARVLAVAGCSSGASGDGDRRGA